MASLKKCIEEKCKDCTSPTQDNVFHNYLQR